MKICQSYFEKVSNKEFADLLLVRMNTLDDIIIEDIFRYDTAPDELVNFCRNKLYKSDKLLSTESFRSKHYDEIVKYRNVFEEYIRRGNSLKGL